MTSRTSTSSITILGSTVNLINASSTLDTIERWIRDYANEQRPHQVVVSGFHGLWEGAKSPQVRKVLNQADLWVPDGIAPVAIARMRGYGRLGRVPGAELMQMFFERSQQRSYRSFFYGSTAETLAGLEDILGRKYPQHTVAGTISPPFRSLSEDEDKDYITQINEAQPDVLWVSLGMPHQDQWIYDHLHRLNVPVVIGVGAAFEFISGRVKRAPAWIGDLGLEWAYRLLREPCKCWRRSLIEGPRFIGSVIGEQLGLLQFPKTIPAGPNGSHPVSNHVAPLTTKNHARPVFKQPDPGQRDAA